MQIDYNKNRIDMLSQRVRAILGVPEEILIDDVVTSPDFLIRANKYINKKISEYEGLDESLIKIAYIYYVCYMLCPGMYSRLPKQMKNVNTTTEMQTIDWDAIALDMLDKCNDIIDEAIEEVSEEEVQYGATFAKLSSESSYPNTTI